MNVYLGHSFDASTLHFEHEVCPACSTGKDKGGRLVRVKYPWWKIEGFWMPYGLPRYDRGNHRIVFFDIKREDFPSDDAYATKGLDTLYYLRCSRTPDCRYLIADIKKCVLLDEPSSLLDAQNAYRMGNVDTH